MLSVDKPEPVKGILFSHEKLQLSDKDVGIESSISVCEMWWSKSLTRKSAAPSESFRLIMWHKLGSILKSYRLQLKHNEHLIFLTFVMQPNSAASRWLRLHNQTKY